ncbi:hypothetical protein [Mycobacterium sp. MMS18-G62]
MMFPRRLMRSHALLTLAAAMTIWGLVSPAANADDDVPPPPLHNVHYTVWSEAPFNVVVYYRDVDPPNWADYSHNPYQFSPKIEADVGPNQQWNLDVPLANPDEWAMVVASAPETQKTPNIHCALAVDGVVVATNQGPKGALCSLRNW